MTEQRLDRPAQHSPAAPAASEGMSVRAGAPTPPDLRGAPPPLDAGSEPSSDARAENSEIERRVLALERILQALVAHMAETEPKFLARLSDSFCVPLRMNDHAVGAIVLADRVNGAVYTIEELEETAKLLIVTRGMAVRHLDEGQIVELEQTFRMR